MKTTTQELDEIVNRWHADTEPPASLRVRVLDSVEVAPSSPVVPAPSRRRVLWATGSVLVLSSASAIAFLAFWTPALPAYADVSRAMSQVKTVQWREVYTSYEPARNVTIRGVTYGAARLNPPALYTRMDDHGKILYILLTPRRSVERVAERDRFTGKWKTIEAHSSESPVADSAEVVRKQINMHILPPIPTGADNRNPTTVRNVTLDGRSLLRFDSQLGRKPHSTDKLTRPGSRFIVWADPETHLAVRTQFEYYDGRIHCMTVCDAYRYNEPLPATLFDTSSWK